MRVSAPNLWYTKQKREQSSIEILLYELVRMISAWLIFNFEWTHKYSKIVVVSLAGIAKSFEHRNAIYSIHYIYLFI